MLSSPRAWAPLQRLRALPALRSRHCCRRQSAARTGLPTRGRPEAMLRCRPTIVRGRGLQFPTLYRASILTRCVWPWLFSGNTAESGVPLSGVLELPRIPPWGPTKIAARCQICGCGESGNNRWLEVQFTHRLLAMSVPIDIAPFRFRLNAKWGKPRQRRWPIPSTSDAALARYDCGLNASS